MPQYSEPADNGWPALAGAAAQVYEHNDAVFAACDTGAPLPYACQAAVSGARDALAKDCVRPRPVGVHAPDSETIHLRTLARAMIAEGQTLEREGHTSSAARMYVDVLKISPITARNGEVIRWLAGRAIVALVAPHMSRCIGSGALAENDLQGLLADLNTAAADAVPFHESLAVEWQMRDELMATLESGDTPFITGPTGEEIRLAAAGRDPYREEMARAIAAAKHPSPREPYQGRQFGNWMIDPSLESLGRLMAREPDTRTLLTGLRVHAAIQLYSLRNGRHPASLSDLSDVGIEPTPTDPYTGEPVLYRQRDGGYVLYSAGPDGVDGGGARRLDTGTYQGDMIIWPWGKVYEAKEAAG